MKKVLFLMLGLLVFSCGANNGETSENKESTQVEQTVENNQTITFNGNDNVVYTLVTENNFETAKLNDEVELKRVESADGIKLESEDASVSLHFKDEMGTLTKDGKEIELTISK